MFTICARFAVSNAQLSISLRAVILEYLVLAGIEESAKKAIILVVYRSTQGLGTHILNWLDFGCALSAGPRHEGKKI